MVGQVPLNTHCLWPVTLTLTIAQTWVLLVQKFILLFLHFPEQVVSIQHRNVHVLGFCAEIHHSKLNFSPLICKQSQKLRTSISKTHYIYHPLRNILNIWNFPTCQLCLFLELKPNPNIQDQTPTIQPVSKIILGIPYSYRYLFNWQCYNQY